MRRWHEAHCSDPDIVVLPNKTLLCNRCKARPAIDSLISDNVSAGSVPLVPADLPSGQMNLWWPRSVPYSTTLPSPGPNEGSGQPLLTYTENGVGPVSARRESTYSALASDEFRLIFMEPVDDPGIPIHLALEVYSLDDCPEYETVSYTWAGEDGDGALCRPIYIGEYWDVLLQTKNCWDMLQFMRPSRIARIVWVDAICINQADTLERNIQVANMGRIYSACSRVVVYLGPDISVPVRDRHPRRRRLHELESGTIKPYFPSAGDSTALPPPYKLSEILKRRYFSRVWVIQELILSQRVVIRIGDVDFWADPAMATHFSSNVPRWNWGRTPAAWVQFISTGTSNAKNLKELLWLTSLARATDPRDRLFGLLGIMPELSNRNTKPKPKVDTDFLNIKEGELEVDYSISCQHMFIGLFAHCLLNLRQPNILYHASCVEANMSNYPSWAPNWTSATTWKILFQAPKLTNEDVFEHLRELVEKGYQTPNAENKPLSVEEFDLYELTGPAQPHVLKERHWCQGSYIDASTGALNINLTQYMTISHPVTRVGTISGLHIFEMQSESFRVYMLSEQNLDTILFGNGNEDLFVLNRDDYSFVYLLLRRLAGKEGKKVFKLISTCPFVQIMMRTRRSANEVPTIRALRLNELQQSAYDLIKECQEILDSDNLEHFKGWKDKGILVNTKTPRKILPALKQLYCEKLQRGKDVNELEEVTEGECIEYVHPFAKSYIGCIDEKYSASFDGEYVMIFFSTAWKDMNELYFFQRGWMDRRMEKLTRRFQSDEEVDWEYRFKDTGPGWELPNLSASAYKKLMQADVERWVEVRFPISWVRSALLSDTASYVNQLFENIDRISSCLKKKGDDLWTLLEQDLDPDLRFISSPNHRLFFGMQADIHDLIDQLGIRVSIFMVEIE